MSTGIERITSLAQVDEEIQKLLITFLFEKLQRMICLMIGSSRQRFHGRDIEKTVQYLDIKPEMSENDSKLAFQPAIIP